ncbi:bleomycin resistance protein [Natrarchaeobius halalkaliphilus]|uniref:Bleomycin resistance protein n=1 Tax=Natrarchaeobius halalkaliphilus TaxID=1679091 RepID=A0A3N6LHP2_9EURY|nr:VOC family protein [Natrarchaeobius halalkaliphilus]RQG86694.1 bleomycin resistance protein [Natrarchaeobius halalkaliphilus]
MVVDNMGLDHVAIKVRDIEQTIEFYTDVMNMAVSDRIGDTVAFLRTPAVSEQADHHEMNITQYSDEELDVLEQRGELELDLHEFEEDLPEGGPPMLPTTGPIYHIAFEVPNYQSIRDAADELEARNHPIYRGPGRHGPGNNIFLYFPDPDGYPIELTAKMEEAPEDGGRPARQWPQSPDTWNVWRNAEDL